jgi:hypothetical protein
MFAPDNRHCGGEVGYLWCLISTSKLVRCQPHATTTHNLTDKMEVHPRRIVAEVDGNYYEMLTISQAAEILCLSQVKVKSLMFGRKRIQGKLSYVTVPELTTKQWHGNLRVLVDDNFRQVAQELARMAGKVAEPLVVIKKGDFDY